MDIFKNFSMVRSEGVRIFTVNMIAGHIKLNCILRVYANSEGQISLHI